MIKKILIETVNLLNIDGSSVIILGGLEDTWLMSSDTSFDSG